jgi:hypothetical protein
MLGKNVGRALHDCCRAPDLRQYKGYELRWTKYQYDVETRVQFGRYGLPEIE